MAQARRSAGVTRRNGPEGENPWAPLRWPAALSVLVLVYGSAGYMAIEKWSLVDSVYMTLLALTTVGFKEVHPLGTAGRIFTMSVLAAGVTLVLVTLSLVARSVAEGGLGERARRRRMQRKIDSLNDHFIVCAYGRVGRTVAREFEAEGVPFVVVDADEEAEDEMMRDGVFYLVGDATSELVLQAAGIDRARGLISAMDSDASNVYVTLSARAMNQRIFIVARAAEATTADRLYRAGADRVISPYVESGRHMALMAVRPRVVDFLEVAARGAPPLRLEELLVEDGSDLVGRPVREASTDAMVLAIRRRSGDVVQNPGPDLRLESGDLLVLMGESEALRAVEQD